MSLSMIIQLTCSTVFTVFFVKWLVNYYKFFRKLEKIPLFKGAVPIVGHLKQFYGASGKLWTMIKEISNAANEGDGYILLRMGILNQIVVTDPEIALTVMNSCFNKNYVYKFASCWLGNGIIQADTDEWKVHRKLINPTFGPHVLNGFIGVFNAQSQWLVKEMRSNVGIGLFDPRRTITKQSLKTVCQTVLGIAAEDDSIIDEEYIDAAEKMFMLLADRIVHVQNHSSIIYAATEKKRKQDQYVKVLHNMSRSMMMKRKAEREQGLHKDDSNSGDNVSANRFTASLDLLLGMAEKGQIDLEQIRMELDTFIAAGHDTSNRAVLYTLIYIGSFPGVQQKIYEEVQSVLGSKEFIDKDDLPKLVYTEAVIKESLRVSPVVPMVGRQLDKDVIHNNIVFPQGVNVIMSIWGIHHNRKIWGPDVEEFKPERWLDTDSKLKSINAYCPFSIGKRNCIGRHYAYMSMKVTVSYLVRHFKIFSDHSKLKTNFDVLLRATEGYEISLEQR